MADLHDALRALDDELCEFGTKLCDRDDEIIGLTTITNAECWSCDECEIVMVRQLGPDEFEFEADLTLSGEQIDDKPWSGREISATLKGRLVQTGASLHISEDDYAIVESELVDQ